MKCSECKECLVKIEKCKKCIEGNNSAIAFWDKHTRDNIGLEIKDGDCLYFSEKDILIEKGIGIKELRQLQDLASVNKALNDDEFMEIVGVYNKTIERLLKQNKI